MQGAATLPQEQAPSQQKQRQQEIARLYHVDRDSEGRVVSGINKKAQLNLKISRPLNNRDYIVLYIEGSAQEQLAAKERLRELEEQLKLPNGVTLLVVT